jgi:hypothetical protein
MLDQLDAWQYAPQELRKGRILVYEQAACLVAVMTRTAWHVNITQHCQPGEVILLHSRQH